jgi:hypothetical protein
MTISLNHLITYDIEGAGRRSRFADRKLTKMRLLWFPRRELLRLERYGGLIDLVTCLAGTVTMKWLA